MDLSTLSLLTKYNIRQPVLINLNFIEQAVLLYQGDKKGTVFKCFKFINLPVVVFSKMFVDLTQAV